MTPGSVIKLMVGVIEVVNLAVDVADKFVDVLKKAGVIKNTQNSDELGAKVLHGQEINITPDALSTKQDYEDYARKIDTLQLPSGQDYSPEEKRNAVNKFITDAMNVRYGNQNGVNDFLKEVNDHKEYYSPQRIEAYMDKANQNDLNMSKIGDYLGNNLDSMQDIRKTETVLIDAERSLGVDDEAAKEKFDAERDKRGNL